jgi:hypothetical protein
MIPKRYSVLALLSLLLSLTVVPNVSSEGWDSRVSVVESVPNKVVRIEGDLRNGQRLGSLDWAWSSSNACFPATQNSKFTGNHVFFATRIPSHSIMKITVKPGNGNTNLSLYAYQIGTTDFSLPENLARCVTCEADHKWDRPWRGKIQTSARSVELNAIANPYNVFIGVAGADGLAAGEFTLEIELKQ